MLAVLCLALPGVALAGEPSYPALSGRVVDQAGILSEPTRQTLTGWLEGFERDTSTQVVVATVKSLGDASIEDYGVGLGRAWGIGQKGKNTGAILLVAPNDRQVRIEVGYGLEGELTDALSSAIIQQQIIPSFKQGDYEGGVLKGTAAILTTLGWKGAPNVSQPVAAPSPVGVDWPTLVIIGFFLLPWMFRVLFGLGRRRRPGIWGAGSGWGSDDRWGGGGWGGGGFSGGGGSFGGGGATGRW
jgi:uncharacterized protein